MCMFSNLPHIDKIDIIQSKKTFEVLIFDKKKSTIHFILFNQMFDKYLETWWEDI